ncbi:DUF2730 family protein [Azospirillum agricola]|uniref:DUF2730 family protein n=1 Tax=Azospirillum agricola TaxID=1720247 RepID=UPI000A0F1942|nr:DUF2730 family protein [Azospirillum agricola]MBP2231786.1 hypothetical protein [Azospirillum agricola]SMH62547.1 Protein of unknown function [Azospirillum lipoferum]
MEAVTKWGWAAALVFNTVLAWIVWSLRTGYVSRSDHDALGTRVALIERDLTHLPTADDFAKMRGEFATLKGQSEAQQQLLNRIAASVTRIEDFLLKAKV